ncbi:aminoglycoside phosphotransferase family protein [Streptomyces sp. SRF1]|uniref:aminoglycoside phosphotransferase family protein n=1 Tax=Streptomyces sp. SRF1 TaxID=1549642 RepID=UPI0025B25BE4|nr:aminoglycoside phosphotransferase family protein [Streptomyces sp. SRF1]MDN3061312.1 aminoglycoside phosphotransferase family protein [Streptomyces sp. SRF1]
MTTSAAKPAHQVLMQACASVGLDATAAEPVRLAENQIWKLPGQQVILRVARAGQLATASREVRVAHWLADNGVPAVRPLDVDQPVVVEEQPVTFWVELPEHKHGTATDVAILLKTLHSLPKPDIALGYLDPFVRVSERMAAATAISRDDAQWLHGLHQELAVAWAERPTGMRDCAVHGDAWPGNLVRTATGPLMMDLERFSVGPPEWDLVSTAVRRMTTGAVSAEEYHEFCEAYGADVTEWHGYQALAGIRELRMVTYALQHAASNPAWGGQAQYRIDCLRGRYGPRPWEWKGIL